MTENDLFHKTLTKDTTLINLIEGTSCKVVDLGSGDTDFTVERMAQMVYDTLPQTVKIAKELRRRHGDNISAIHKALNDFLWNNYKYKFDGYFQDLRSPGCAKSSRLEGIDCKGVSITASSILINLGITHSIRRVKKMYDRPDEFTHVYVVIHHNGKTLAVDGTTNIYEEQPYNQADDYIMKHRGLNLPQTTNPQKAASASRHARMLKNGTTKSVRSIGGKGLARYRASLGLPTITYPKQMNEASAKIATLQAYLERLVKQGANSISVASFLRDLKYNLDNNINAVARLANGKLHLGSKTYDLRPNGLAFSFDFSGLSNVFGGNSSDAGQPAPGSALNTITSSATGGIPVGGSGIGAFAGAGLGTLIPVPVLGTALGGIVGGFMEDFMSNGFKIDCIGGQWYDADDELKQDMEFIDSLVANSMNLIKSAAESGNTAIMSSKIQQLNGKLRLINKAYIAKVTRDSYNSCTTKLIRSVAERANEISSKITSELIPSLEQYYTFQKSSNSVTFTNKQNWITDGLNKMRAAYVGGPDVTHQEFAYNITLKSTLPQNVNTNLQTNPGATQTPTNSQIPNQGTVKTGGISTTTAAVSGGIILTGIAVAALYFSKSEPAA